MNQDDGGQGDRVSAILGMPVEEYLLRDEEAHLVRRLQSMDAEARRGFKAWMLAPTLALYNALMRNERVPWRMLRPEQAARFGLRRRTLDGRYGLREFNDVRR